MTHIFHRHTQLTPPRAVNGEGVYIVDHNGKQYIDASGGAAVSCLGHSHPKVIEAVKDQLDRIPFAHTGFFTTGIAEELADFLASHAPGDLSHVYFVSGGSEAIEAALKLGRQFWLERNQPQRRLFISRKQSYHGNTLGALAVGGNIWRKQPYQPLLAETHHISPCYAYRDQRADETEFEYGQRVANELDAKVLELGAENIIGFVAEPVVGATLGASTAVPGYFTRIREICDQHDILLILDEVMCGMGRTGTLFACQHEQIQGDLITIAKGLGAGYQPIGATIVSERIYQTIKQGSGFFQHGHTYLAHACACAAALAVQKVIEDEDLLANVDQQGAYLQRCLEQRFSQPSAIGDIRGRGLFRAIEFVEDFVSKRPFPAQKALHNVVKRTAMEHGLVCYPMGGTIDGKNGSHVLLAPPFIVDSIQIDEIVDRLGKAVNTAIDEIGRN